MLQWEAPTTNLDGSPLTDLMGYRLYRGVAPGAYTDSQDLGLPSCTAPTTGLPTCSHPLTDLPSGDHYLAVTAYDTDGYESLFSNEAFVSLP